MRKLHGQMRHYPWGSRTHLAELTGRLSPSAQPEAEIWYGAHPAEPCALGDAGDDGERTLAATIAADPGLQLGGNVVRRFGAELPFLVKLLAAGEPLSLQAHPSAAQAQAGFARENALGVALDDPKRNYKDPRHKPELLVALTRFEALAGFRDARQTLGQLERAGLLAQLPEAVLLRDHDLRGLVERWLLMPVDEVARRVAAVRAAGHPVGADLAQRYPHDPGVLVALLLHHIVLEPGEGLFVPAGVLHAYLGGLGVEVMANSDNVLRGGLTSKHVDVDELLAVMDFAPIPQRQLVVRSEDSPASSQYPGLATEFRLRVTRLANGEAQRAPSGPALEPGPEILLCVSGEAEIETGGRRERITPGEAVWRPAHERDVDITARADATVVFRASV
ncbi:mannose-6-phosphate isomerase, class I [Segniliparus rotundus DSM 44985]|uniref:mannose-6-phosphate isomerase n=1 Tax=Segniliparus rotundus (strain ATCC BAA-972 / CDC 1076 / CIP 108378 / DSM 44985 / JCM 13578) TaxID=640132 RepID=D6ZCS2_SEGRD|nr:mannose-6-phosphate isomerase, class I [Segniliparus rotundus]ADG97114.1 mannose-6-phosphate isomerase, class I [Segniliparus rotundus DSM 44985]